MFYQAVVAKGSVTKYGKRKGEIRGGGRAEAEESLKVSKV